MSLKGSGMLTVVYGTGAIGDKDPEIGPTEKPLDGVLTGAVMTVSVMEMVMGPDGAVGRGPTGEMLETGAVPDAWTGEASSDGEGENGMYG